MAVGERGGSVHSLEEAEILHEQYKKEWVEKIRWRIVARLVDHGTFHAKHLVELGIPPDCKKVVGSCVGAAKTKGLMEETLEREASTDPTGHRRKSAWYRITDHGRDVLPGRLARYRAKNPPEPTQLFEAPEAADGPGHIDRDQREAAA